MANTCIFCGLDVESQTSDLICFITCPNCGEYKITYKTLSAMPYYLEHEISEQRHLISGYLREMTELGMPPVLITSENYQNLIDSARVPTTIMEKLDKILIYLYKKSEYLYQEIKVNVNESAIGYAKNNEEYASMIGALQGLDLLILSSQVRPFSYKLTLAGIQRAESLVRETTQSDQAFVAMWFDDSMVEVFDKYISKGIEEAGYKPLIITVKEHNDSITDQIIAEIRRSQFVVADFTGDRGGVYFEAGFAYGLNKPVIWTCREDWFNNELNIVREVSVDGRIREVEIRETRKVHFDISHYNFIVWKDGNELRERLKNRILATIPKGN